MSFKAFFGHKTHQRRMLKYLTWYFCHCLFSLFFPPKQNYLEKLMFCNNDILKIYLKAKKKRTGPEEGWRIEGRKDGLNKPSTL